MHDRLYIVATGAKLDVFDEPVSSTLVLNQTLAETQDAAAQEAKLVPIRVPTLDGLQTPYFTMPDDLFVTGRFLSTFKRSAKTRRGGASAGLANNPILGPVCRGHRQARAVEGGFTYPLRYCAGEQEEPLLVEIDDLEWSTARMPRALAPEGYIVFPETSLGIIPVEAPLHVYQANLHANMDRMRRIATRLRLVGARLEDPQERLGNTIAKSAQVHPTAVVEGSTVGEGAIIGPGAVVRHSVVGTEAIVAEGAVLLRAVIGARTTVSCLYRVVHAVCYPESFLISGALQFSIVGRESAIFATWITDVRMDRGTIRTPIHGQLQDSGHRFLGIAVGHRSKVTAGLVTAPGRIVPNDTEIHLDPAGFYRGLPEGHPPGEPFFVA